MEINNQPEKRTGKLGGLDIDLLKHNSRTGRKQLGPVNRLADLGPDDGDGLGTQPVNPEKLIKSNPPPPSEI